MFTFCEHLVRWCTLLVISGVAIMDLAEFVVFKYASSARLLWVGKNKQSTLWRRVLRQCQGLTQGRYRQSALLSIPVSRSHIFIFGRPSGPGSAFLTQSGHILCGAFPKERLYSQLNCEALRIIPGALTRVPHPSIRRQRHQPPHLPAISGTF